VEQAVASLIHVGSPIVINFSEEFRIKFILNYFVHFAECPTLR